MIMDVEATTAVRQAEVGAAKTMLDRTAEQFDVRPSRLIADGGYGSAEMLGWLVEERGIEPHVKVFDKSERSDGTFSRSDFAYDPQAGSISARAGRNFANAAVCSLRCGPRSPRKAVISSPPARLRGLRAQTQMHPEHARAQDCALLHEAARDKARAIAKTEAYVVSRRQRKKVEMLFAHLKRILRLDRLRLRGPNGAKDEFLLAATAQNLRKLAKLVPLPTPAFAI